MKLILTFLLASAAICTINAQNVAQADTITTVKNPGKVIILETAEKMEVVIEGAGDNPSFRSVTTQEFNNVSVKSHHPYRTLQSTKPGSTINFLDNITLLTGMVTAPGDGKIDIEMSKSFEISVPEIIGVKIGRRTSASSLSVSMGFGWRNYRTTKGMAMTGNGDGKIGISDEIDAGQLKFSRLKMFSLSFPVMYRWQTPVKVMRKKMSVRVGAVLNWNSHASLKTSILDKDGDIVNISTDKIGHREFSVDILGMINVTSNVGFYCRYCPTPMLRDGHGPQFRTLSAGLAFSI